MAVAPKNKRRLIYKEKTYYWFVRKNKEGIPRLHILSDDKKMNLDLPLFDTEVPIAGDDIVRHIEHYVRTDEDRD